MSITLIATSRTDLGKGASRRLRHSDQTPGIVYGAGKDPISVTFEHKELMKVENIEAFYSSVLALNVDGVTEKVVLKAIQRHVFKDRIQHLDLLRVNTTTVLNAIIPIHFLNAETATAVKNGGVVAHLANELEVTCLATDLPSFIEVDLQDLELGQIIFLSDITLPKGVESVSLNKDDSHDLPIVSITVQKVLDVEDADSDEDVDTEATE